MDAETLYAGRFLKLMKRGRWEFAQRVGNVEAAFIGAITKDKKFLINEEYRVALNTWVIGCPAGLIGDVHSSEDLRTAVNRELIEEAGYEASEVHVLSKGPTSAGLTDEQITLVLATQLTRVSAGGGIDGEQIRIHEVPLTEIDAWLASKEKEGRAIDAKVYAVLYFARQLGLA
jgi:ADP-ribose pyrophosphatase